MTGSHHPRAEVLKAKPCASSHGDASSGRRRMPGTGWPPRTCAPQLAASGLCANNARTFPRLCYCSLDRELSETSLLSPRTQPGRPPRRAAEKARGLRRRAELRAAAGAGREEGFPEASATRRCRSSRSRASRRAPPTTSVRRLCGSRRPLEVRSSTAAPASSQRAAGPPASSPPRADLWRRG